MVKKHIYYHGTNKKNAEKIKEDGFKVGTFFASHLEDALEFGGSCVFEVVFNKVGFNGWQFQCSYNIPVSRIVSFSIFTIVKISDNDKLRKKIFNTNI